MTRSYDYRLLFPDARHKGKKTPLAKSLDQAGISVVSTLRSTHPPDAVLTWFHGRNRVSKSSQSLIKKIKCPVIGLELPEAGNRDDPVIQMDLQLNHDTPYPLVAHIIRSVIETHRLRQQVAIEEIRLEKMRTNLDKVVELGIQLTQTLSYHELFDRVVEHAATLVKGDIHALFTVNSEGTSSRLRAAVNQETCGAFRIAPTHRMHRDSKASLMKSTKPISDVAPFDQHPVIAEVTRQLGTLETAIVAPFVSKDHLLGFLVIGRQSKETLFNQTDIEQIEILSSFSSMAMANAFVYEQTETATRIDNLTQVYNFAYIKQFLDRLVSVQESFSLVFVDLDGFKKVNLLHGHTRGNAALKAAATKIVDSLQPFCMVGRFGGDEFVVVMPGTSAEDAQISASQIIQSIESLEKEMDLRLSASAGIAEYPLDGDTLQFLIHAADTAMYTAKERGRGHALLYREITED